MESLLTNMSPQTLDNVLPLLKVVILATIAAAAISARLFSVIRYIGLLFTSILTDAQLRIHHPRIRSVASPHIPPCEQQLTSRWFNFRASKILVNTSFQAFWNWFDSRSWYPLGRVAGGTLYPGLMVTSAIIHNFLQFINLPVDIRNVCVLLAPGFSALTALATYLFTREMSGDGAGLLAAAFIGIAPGLISFPLFSTHFGTFGADF